MQLIAEHQQWRAMWQEIAEYIHPRRSQFMSMPTPGQKQTAKIFDSTALDANERLAATLNGTLTNRATPWFSLTIRDEELAQDFEVMEWLEDCDRRMYRAYNQSNFDQETHELYLDEPALGTAGIFVDEYKPESPQFEGLCFTSLPLTHFAIDEDQYGRVNTIYRTFFMSAASAVAKWGEKAGEKVYKAFTEGKLSQIFEFCHAIRPRAYGVDSNPAMGTPKTNLPFESIYASVEDGYQIIQEGGYHEFPCMVPRWSKTTGEKYGRGVGHVALADVKTLNKLKEITLKTAAKNLNMPTKSREDVVIGGVKDVPGGNTVLRDIDGLQPLYPPGSLQDSLGANRLTEEPLKESIRKYFFADLTNMPQGPMMTAYEFQKRMEMVHRTLGPTMGRQETEFLNPLNERVFGIMYRRGAFSPPPAVLLERGADIDVRYQGALAKSQRLSEVEGMERLTGYVVQASQLDPSVLDNINFDETVRLGGDVLGVPVKVFRSPEEVAQIRKQRAQTNAAQQQKADLAQVAESAGKAAPALKLLQPQGAA